MKGKEQIQSVRKNIESLPMIVMLISLWKYSKDKDKQT